MEKVRAIRGATTVASDTREEILSATRELIKKILHRNCLEPEKVISAFFTVTPDLTAAFPAEAVRQLGYTQWPAIGSVEMPVPDALDHCIRVMLHIYLDSQQKIEHVYIHGAQALRPDRVNNED
jgi:chorismate mutase